MGKRPLFEEGVWETVSKSVYMIGYTDSVLNNVIQKV